MFEEFCCTVTWGCGIVSSATYCSSIYVNIYSSKQGIFEIEAGAFDESQPTHEIVFRKCPIIFFRNFFCGSGKHLIICTYTRKRMNTYAYEYFSLSRKARQGRINASHECTVSYKVRYSSLDRERTGGCTTR